VHLSDGRHSLPRQPVEVGERQRCARVVSSVPASRRYLDSTQVRQAARVKHAR